MRPLAESPSPAILARGYSLEDVFLVIAARGAGVAATPVAVAANG